MALQFWNVAARGPHGHAIGVARLTALTQGSRVHARDAKPFICPAGGMADAPDSKPGDRKVVPVRVWGGAPNLHEWPSGKAFACKANTRQFDSDLVLQVCRPYFTVLGPVPSGAVVD